MRVMTATMSASVTRMAAAVTGTALPMAPAISVTTAPVARATITAVPTTDDAYAAAAVIAIVVVTVAGVPVVTTLIYRRGLTVIHVAAVTGTANVAIAGVVITPGQSSDGGEQNETCE